MFNKYYLDELNYLRELGGEFARANPAVAHMLAESGSDPDVERLLEGVAFLTGRIRQKLDDELPELTQSMMQLLWPHYLRPVPSMAILEFEPQPHLLRAPTLVPRGSEVAAEPREGTSCRFRTCYDVTLLPLSIEAVTLHRPMADRTRLDVRFRVEKGARFADLKLDRLRLYLHGEPVMSSSLYLWLRRHLDGITVAAADGGKPGRRIRLAPEACRPVGFAPDEALLPYPAHSFEGYRLLQEYFALPRKYLFVELTGLAAAADLKIEDAFDLSFVFSTAPDENLRVGQGSVRLHCTPIVNLFAMPANPLRINHEVTEYRVRSSGQPSAHYEIFSVDRAAGLVAGSGEVRTYAPFHSFQHSDGSGLSASTGGREAATAYYHHRLREAVVHEGTETYLSFVNQADVALVPPEETVSIDLTCTNRALAADLRIGDVNRPTSTSPQTARFRNITECTRSVSPPLGGGLYWRLISHLTLNYLSLTSAEALRGIVSLYNFRRLVDRQAARENELRLAGIERVTSRAAQVLLSGAPVRGTDVRIDLNEDNFSGEGDLYLFAEVLSEFMALYATLNSFARLTVSGTKRGEVYRWPAKIGRQIAL